MCLWNPDSRPPSEMKDMWDTGHDFFQMPTQSSAPNLSSVPALWCLHFATAACWLTWIWELVLERTPTQSSILTRSLWMAVLPHGRSGHYSVVITGGNPWKAQHHVQMSSGTVLHFTPWKSNFISRLGGKYGGQWSEQGALATLCQKMS